MADVDEVIQGSISQRSWLHSGQRSEGATNHGEIGLNSVQINSNQFYNSFHIGSHIWWNPCITGNTHDPMGNGELWSNRETMDHWNHDPIGSLDHRESSFDGNHIMGHNDWKIPVDYENMHMIWLRIVNQVNHWEPWIMWIIENHESWRSRIM